MKKMKLASIVLLSVFFLNFLNVSASTIEEKIGTRISNTETVSQGE